MKNPLRLGGQKTISNRIANNSTQFLKRKSDYFFASYHVFTFELMFCKGESSQLPTKLEGGEDGVLARQGY